MTTITTSGEEETQVSPTKESHSKPEVDRLQDPPKVAAGKRSKAQKTKKGRTPGGKVRNPSKEMKSPPSAKKFQQQQEKTQNELFGDVLQTERNFIWVVLVLATFVCLGLAVYATANVVLDEYPVIQSMIGDVVLKPHSECDRIRNEARDWVSLAVVRQSYYFIVYYLIETVLLACLLLVIWLPESDPSCTTDEDDLNHPRKVIRRADYPIFTSIQRVGTYLLQQTFFVMGLTIYYVDRRLSNEPPLLFEDDFFGMLWASKGFLLFVYVAVHFNREFVDEKKGSRTILQRIISGGKFDPVKDMKERMDEFNKKKEAKSKDKKKKADTSKAAKSEVESKGTSESSSKSLDETLKPQAEPNKTAVESTGSDQTGPPNHPVSDQIFKVGKASPTKVTSSCQTPD